MNLEFLVTRSIYENPDISQREMAKDFSVSLGKINSIVKLAENKGLLRQNKKNSFYEITEDGKREVEKYKVDGAVILACGMGIRLAPFTYDTPKSFLKIKGERMIERQIEQLKSVGIDNITIMVGYLKEKFDYLIDKYNVKLVYNEEYKEKNTLSTFYHAIDLLRGKNMYVCVSDVYIAKNIYHKYECEPYYTGAFYENCDGEWRYVINNKSEIKGVILGGENDYCLVGPCFLTKDFLEKLIPMIEDYYHRTSTNGFYWEDVLVNNFKLLPSIYLYKHDKGVIFEFDNINDLKRFDRDSGDYGSEAVEFVSKALNIKSNEITNIECVKEGMTNNSYKFEYNGEHYFVRIPGEGTEKYIDRQCEAEVLNSLKDKNITEDIIFLDKNSGYKVSKYIDDSRPLDINDDSELKACMALYRRFHSFGIKVSQSSDIVEKINEYLSIIKDKDVYVPYEDFDKILLNEKKIADMIKNEDRPFTLCHGDPNPNNVLVTKSGLKLIDFEYAGMADPLSDIALFGVYVGFDIEKTLMLYKMYKESSVGTNSTSPLQIIPHDDNLAHILIISYMALGGLYNAVWAMVRTALGGADYGEFGMKGYRNFKNCYSALQEKNYE